MSSCFFYLLCTPAVIKGKTLSLRAFRLNSNDDYDVSRNSSFSKKEISAIPFTGFSIVSAKERCHSYMVFTVSQCICTCCRVRNARLWLKDY